MIFPLALRVSDIFDDFSLKRGQFSFSCFHGIILVDLHLLSTQDVLVTRENCDLDR